MERQTGHRPPQLELPPFPQLLQQEWQWFLALHRRRQSSGFGLNPLAWAEMRAYFEFISARPTTTQLQIIERLDDVVLRHYAEKTQAEQKQRQAGTARHGKARR